MFTEDWLRGRLADNPHLKVAGSIGGAQPPRPLPCAGSPGAPGEPTQASADPLALAVLPHRRADLKLGKEDAVQAEIVTRLEIGTRQGRWQIVPVMLSNEIRIPVPSKARVEAQPQLVDFADRQKRLAGQMGARLLAMGLLPGAPDLMLLMPGRIGFVECKVPGGGKVSPEQAAVRDLMRAWGLLWAVARTWPQLLDTLREWKVPGAANPSGAPE